MGIEIDEKLVEQFVDAVIGLHFRAHVRARKLDREAAEAAGKTYGAEGSLEGTDAGFRSYLQETYEIGVRAAVTQLYLSAVHEAWSRVNAEFPPDANDVEAAVDSNVISFPRVG
jgi:hypothetical protein